MKKKQRRERYETAVEFALFTRLKDIIIEAGNGIDEEESHGGQEKGIYLENVHRKIEYVYTVNSLDPTTLLAFTNVPGDVATVAISSSEKNSIMQLLS
mmetsp:Transcript_20483/g.28790  ORF Transcript_20483/g.28790 Transcript_20483/m.28790 type:complete len:98 (+) Transcript_20483:167-460(+)